MLQVYKCRVKLVCQVPLSAVPQELFLVAAENKMVYIRTSYSY